MMNLRREINPILAVFIIVLFIAIVGAVVWRNLPQSAPPGEGRKMSDLDLSKAQQDPVEFRRQVQELLERERKERGGK